MTSCPRSRAVIFHGRLPSEAGSTFVDSCRGYRFMPSRSLNSVPETHGFYPCSLGLRPSQLPHHDMSITRYKHLMNIPGSTTLKRFNTSPTELFQKRLPSSLRPSLNKCESEKRNLVGSFCCIAPKTSQDAFRDAAGSLGEVLHDAVVHLLSFIALFL